MLAILGAGVQGEAHLRALQRVRTFQEVRIASRERMIEDEKWDVAQDLLHVARLRRQKPELVERYGATAVDAAAYGLSWGAYQLLGKLCPTVYVWERRA